MNALTHSRLAVAISLFCVAGCGGGDFAPRILFEDFETLCDGVPCGWTLTDGDPANVEYVETIHPGVHGFALSEETTLNGPGGEVIPFAGLAFGSLQAEVSVRCDDPDARLIIRALGESSARTAPELFEGETFGSDAWGRYRISLVGSRGVDAPISGMDFQILSLALAKRGPGTCVIDTLEIDDLGSF